MPQKIVIKQMFNSIAKRYDFMNNFLSLGMHWLWKKKLVYQIISNRPASIHDVATGTGDIVELIHSKDASIDLVGTDISEKMLELAIKKFELKKNIRFQIDDITQSSFSDHQFDISCISFGIRNVSNIELALSELARTTKKKIFILEFGTPQNAFFRKIYFSLMKVFMPLIGRIFSDKKSYNYLIESSINFPSDKKMIELIDSSVPKSQSTYTALFGGICYLYEIDLK